MNRSINQCIKRAVCSLSCFILSLSLSLGPDRKIRLMKMDTEGSEIDILNSGMALFEERRVDAFVVEVTPSYPGGRSWEEVKGVSLEVRRSGVTGWIGPGGIEHNRAKL